MRNALAVDVREPGPTGSGEVSETIIALEAKFDLIASELRRIGRVPDVSRTLLTNEGARYLVERAISDRTRRSDLFPSCLFADPAWDILLHLYRAEVVQVRASISRVCAGSRVPATTGLRWIGILESRGLIAREEDRFDRRRVYLRLTDKGSAAMAQYFSASTVSSRISACTE